MQSITKSKLARLSAILLIISLVAEVINIIINLFTFYFPLWAILSVIWNYSFIIGSILWLLTRKQDLKSKRLSRLRKWSFWLAIIINIIWSSIPPILFILGYAGPS